MAVLPQRTGEEIVADRIMRRLSAGGRTGVFLGAIVVLLVALFLPGWYGAILLVAMVSGLGWLMTKTWRVAAPQTRTLRLLVLVLLFAIAVFKVTR
jgi:hypothetical protein